MLHTHRYTHLYRTTCLTLLGSAAFLLSQNAFAQVNFGPFVPQPQPPVQPPVQPPGPPVQPPGLSGCQNLPGHGTLKMALEDAVEVETSGLDFDMWATIVDRDGVVCAVAFSGGDRGAQWPGSRVISAQKANTANAFNLDALALSTANLFSAVQPGGSLYGLQHSNPVDTDVAYRGNAQNYGQSNDPMVGGKIGGVNVFGGGLGLYEDGEVVGGLGVSGDTSCADHMIAWRVRFYLMLDELAGVGGVSGDDDRPDNIIYDIDEDGVSAGGFGHPMCLNTDEEVDELPAVN